MESQHYARSGGPRNAVECSQLTLQAEAAGKQQLRVGSYVLGSARMKGAKQRERSSGEKAWRLGCKRDPEEVGVPPRRAWRGQTLRKLPGYGGHAVAHRDTRKSSCTHTSAYGNTLYHWVHTRRPLTRRSREGITGRSCRPAHPHPHPHPPQSFPTRPSKGLRNRRRLQPAPPSPGREKREAGGGKGVCPRPLLRWEQRVWEGRGPGGRGPGAYKIALRTHGHKQTLPGYPLTPAGRLLTHLRLSLHLPRGAAPPTLWLVPFRACLLIR